MKFREIVIQYIYFDALVLIDYMSEQSNPSKILSIRVDDSIYEEMKENIDQFHGPSYKISNFVKDFIDLSKIMFIKGNNEKFGYDNRSLAIIPREFLTVLFSYINDRNRPLFEIEIGIGDWIGRYYCDIFKIRSIKTNDEKFDFIQRMGMFEVFKSKDGKVIIPKNFGTEDMIHAFIHRLIYDTQMDYELCRRYLELKVNQYAKIGEEKDKKVRENLTRELEGWNRKLHDLKGVQKEKFKIPDNAPSDQYVFEIE